MRPSSTKSSPSSGSITLDRASVISSWSAILMSCSLEGHEGPRVPSIHVPLLLIVLFIVVPIAELYVIIQVGQAIGVLPTIAILLLDSLIGSWLLRTPGRAVWRRFNATLAAGRVPAREGGDGAVVIFGGALLITPGFISDVLGVILLVPPARAIVRAILTRGARTRVVMRVAGGVNGARREPGPRGYDVDGTAVDVDDPTPRLR